MSRHSELEGLRLVVTGATGIGAATARLAAARGATVFVLSLRAADCEVLADEIVEGGGSCGWRAVDLRDEAATVDAFAAVRADLGAIDGLVAVAGASGRRHGDGPLHDIPLAGWDATAGLNTRPAFLAAREVIRAMREGSGGLGGQEGSGGSIVLVSSVLALHPSPRLFATHAYAAAKGSLVSLTRSLAAYYAPEGIRVNALAPGLVDTPMAARAAADPDTVDYARRKQPLAGGLLDPEAVGEAATFLCSPRSAQITGQVLAVDGGWGVTEA